MSERRMLLGGVYLIGAVGLASAIAPAVEAVVSAVFLGVCVLAGLALLVVVGRWVHSVLTLRRELSAAAVPHTAATRAAATRPQPGQGASTLAELRETA